MSLQNLINGPLGISLILTLGRILPPKLGLALADRVASYLIKQKQLESVRATRANQWVVSGCTLDAQQLDQQTEKTIRNTARWLYDLYHHLHDHQKILEKVTLSPRLIYILDTRLGGDEGTLMVAPHLSNFDLAGRAIVLNGYDIQALSYPRPHGGYQWQNKLRRDAGMNITPMSFESMRTAKDNLLKGGGVVTGLDRPLETTNYRPKFFGFPAPVPTSYVRMALQTGSAVMVIAAVGLPEENYHVECSDLIYMEPDDDPVREIEKNAEKVLREAEKFIRAYPTQWGMTYPVWPFALDEMPQ
jgi:KDO2-lipid IV(A) lauroyltransferase